MFSLVLDYLNMQPVPYYRLWIYIVNGLLIILQSIFVLWSYMILTNSWMILFPLSITDISIITMYVLMALQFIACFCGIIGVLLSNRNIVRIYWFIMIPIIMFDLVAAVFWAVRFSYVHKEHESYMVDVIHKQIKHPKMACNLWKNISTDLNCCPPKIIMKACADISIPLCWLRQDDFGCSLPLLNWLHSKTDVLATLLYFLLYPLKLIVVIVLREDITELFSEIVYNGNKQLYKHWANFESDDEDAHSDSQKSSNHDHESQTMLIEGRRETTQTIESL